MSNNEIEPILPEEEALSIEEEAFCKHVAGGESYTKSLRLSFPKKAKWKQNSLYRVASVLANSPKILKRINEIKEENEKEYFLSYQSKRALIKEKVDDPNISERDRAKYIELDNKMAGHLAATKIESSGALNLTHSVDKSVEQALEKLLG